MSETKTFLFMPESAYGPTNNCIGIGHRLLARGHRVVFAAEASWAGKLEALGFEEDLVDLAPPPEGGDGEEQDAGQFWKDYIREVAPEFRKSTAEQLDTVTKPIWEALIEGARYCEPQLKEIIARVQPDVIVEDNVLTFPALTTAGVPFVRLVSCNPLEVPGPGIAPVFSGLGEHETEAWSDFREEYRRTHGDMWREFDAWVQEQGLPRCPNSSSSTRARSTSTCTPRRSTTSTHGPSAPPGIVSNRRCARPRPLPSSLRASPTAPAPSSTSRSVRSAAPTYRSCAG
ncbi:glycosyltransferase [Leucobacter soli]|uniref:hypothetical protein n=1 Tax=Leucobacter soli TaxID=2812850 RepID=UPI0036231D2A